MPFDLNELGWDAEWARRFAPYAAEGLIPARVAIEFNYIYRLYAEAGELQAQHAGRMRHQAEGRQHLSAVGDWVAALPTPGEASATIEAVLPRRSRFSRKVAGETTEEQIVAANIDTVFLVMGLDGDYNPRRLERYLLMAYESGAKPVVLLNKSDVAEHLTEDLADIATIAVGVPVHAISARERHGIEVIERYLGRGRTGTLLGSSGVGKSTIVNALLGEELLKTRDVRVSDSRGRHTTRHRQLILLPGRGLLIDTPGMRELQLWTQSEGSRETFEDVVNLASGCHFTNCQHREEPRCAVKQAIADGELPAERLASYLKLQEEVHSLGVLKDARAQIDEKRKMKTISQSLKKLYKSRDR
ncbi:MAG: ribosome small subunit-dependent GTPase A [Vicinamibacterales bacterium]